MTDSQAHCARSARDDNSFTRPWLANVEQTKVSGQTRHAQYTQRGRDRPDFGIDFLSSPALAML